MTSITSSLKQDAKYLKFEKELLGSDYSTIMEEEDDLKISSLNSISEQSGSSVYISNLIPDVNDFQDPSREGSTKTTPSNVPSGFDITIDEVEDRFGMDAELKEDVQKTVENLRRLRSQSIHDRPFSQLGAEMPQRYRYESIELFFPTSPQPTSASPRPPRQRKKLADLVLPKAPSPRYPEESVPNLTSNDSFSGAYIPSDSDLDDTIINTPPPEPPNDAKFPYVGDDLVNYSSSEVISRERPDGSLPVALSSIPNAPKKRVPTSPPEKSEDGPSSPKRLPMYVISEENLLDVPGHKDEDSERDSSPPAPNSFIMLKPPDQLIQPIHTRTATPSYAQIEEMFEVHRDHFMSVTHKDVPWDIENLKIRRVKHQLVKIGDFGPSNTPIDPVLLHTLEQVTFENQYLLTLCRILETERTNLSQQNPTGLAEDCIYLAQLITNLETCLACEQELQKFNRTTKKKPRELNLAIAHQKRTLAPGIRLFHAGSSIEIRYGESSCLCSCLHFTELRELICLTWGDEIASKPIFGWVGGGLMTISNPDAFSYFLQAPDRLPSLLIVDSDVLSPDAMKELLKSKDNYEKTERLIQRGLHWEAMSSKSLLYLTWPYKLEKPSKNLLQYAYRFRTTKHNNVHKNTMRFLDLDTKEKIITMTHPDRQNYKIIIDENAISSIRPSTKPCELYLHCEIHPAISPHLPLTRTDSSSFISPLKMSYVSSAPVKGLREQESHSPKALPSTFSSFVSMTRRESSNRSNKPSSPRSVNKQYELIFESPEERNRFLRLTKYYILGTGRESQLYVPPGLMKHISLLPEQAQTKAEIISRIPLELVGAMCHQVWVEYMLDDGWSHWDNGTDAFYLGHENLLPWARLSALVRKEKLLILERFFSYFVRIGVRIEDQTQLPPDTVDNTRESFEDIWLSRHPVESFGHDPSGLFPFVWILAESLHDLHSYMKIRNGFSCGVTSSKTSKINWLRPFSEVTQVSPAYKDMRCNQVCVILKSLRLVGLKVYMDQPFKKASESELSD